MITMQQQVPKSKENSNLIKTVEEEQMKHNKINIKKMISNQLEMTLKYGNTIGIALQPIN